MHLIRYDDVSITIDEAIENCLSWTKRDEKNLNASKSEYLSEFYKIKDILNDITYAELRLIYVCRSVPRALVGQFESALVNINNAKYTYCIFLDKIKKNVFVNLTDAN